MDAALIVGLGNPGAAYRRTRHNVGYMVVDELCHRLNVECVPGEGPYERATARMEGVTVYLVKPTTFMNVSGAAVAQALLQCSLPAEAALVVLDDFQIPLGTLRLRAKGSDGGHNGLGSVIGTLGTEYIPRLRCGIGQENMPPSDGKRDFVLEPFETAERSTVRTMIVRAADAAVVFASSGIDQAMNIYNTQ